VKCRSIENCSLSPIVKKLDVKLDRLFAETQSSLIQRLRQLEIQPSIYRERDLALPLPAPSTGTEAGNEPGAVARFEEIGPTGGATLDPCEQQGEPAQAAIAGAGETNAAARGETLVTAGVAELLSIAACARTFRRPDGGYSLSRSFDGHAECHDLDSPAHGRLHPVG
jgi:hypothetical protein